MIKFGLACSYRIRYNVAAFADVANTRAIAFRTTFRIQFGEAKVARHTFVTEFTFDVELWISKINQIKCRKLYFSRKLLEKKTKFLKWVRIYLALTIRLAFAAGHRSARIARTFCAILSTVPGRTLRTLFTGEASFTRTRAADASTSPDRTNRIALARNARLLHTRWHSIRSIIIADAPLTIYSSR